MRKIIGILLFLILFACETGIEINTDCILKHTAEMARLQSSLGDTEQAFVNLTWTWVLGLPDGDGVIVERNIDAGFDSITYISPIGSLMTFSDTSALLEPGIGVSYRLGFVNGEAVDYFITCDLTIPQTQNILQPDTEFISIPNDTLEIIFSKLQEYDTTDIALYKTSFSSINSVLNTPVTEILQILTNPLIDTTIADTTLTISGADTLIDSTSVYMIKLSSSKMSNLDYITDTSIGLRAFIRWAF